MIRPLFPFRQTSVGSEDARMDYIELLTTDVTGHAIPGPKIPRDRGTAIKYLGPDISAEPDIRLAYRHKFFKRDVHGQPIESTLVEFFVPDWMLSDGVPTRTCLLAVEERMRWADRPS